MSTSAKTTRHIVAGVDPGKNTGYAKWDASLRKMVAVETSQIHRVMHELREGWEAGWLAYVVFEDARLRTYFGTKRGTKEDDALKQGAGSIKRDCTILEDFCQDLGIPFMALSPMQKGRKETVESFARMTGWTARTSNHGRDAGMLVVGREATMPAWVTRAAQEKAAGRKKSAALAVGRLAAGGGVHTPRTVDATAGEHGE